MLGSQGARIRAALLLRGMIMKSSTEENRGAGSNAKGRLLAFKMYKFPTFTGDFFWQDGITSIKFAEDGWEK